MHPIRRLFARACPVLCGQVFPGDYLYIRSCGLPMLGVRTLILVRHADGAYIGCTNTIPGRKERWFEFVSEHQAKELLGFAKLNGLMNAASAGNPATDGYHLAIRLRIGGHRHRFYLNNVSLFRTHPTEAIVRKLEHSLCGALRHIRNAQNHTPPLSHPLQ